MNFLLRCLPKILFVIAAVAAAATGLALAQSSTGTLPAGDTSGAQTAIAGDPDAALARLSDAEVRALLLQRLEGDAAAAAAPERSFNPSHFAYRLQQTVGRIQSHGGAVLSSFSDLPAALGLAYRRIVGDPTSGSFTAFTTVFLIGVGLAGLLEFGLRRRLDAIGLTVSSGHERLAGKAAVSVRRFLVDLGCIVLFAMVVAGVYFLFAAQDPSRRTTFVYYLTALVITRLIYAAANAYFAPGDPDNRIPALSDREARSFGRLLGATVVLGAFGFFTCALFAVHGVVGTTHELVLLLTGTATVLMLLVALAANREAISRDIRSVGDGADRSRLIFARLWPVFAVVFIALMWIGVVLAAFAGAVPKVGAALVTVFLVIFTPSIDAAIEREAALLRQGGQVVLAALGRSGRLALWIAAAAIFLMSWGFSPTGMVGGGLGAALLSGLAQAGVTIIVAYIAWTVTHVWIEQKIAEEEGLDAGKEHDLGEMEIGGAGKSRLRTLLPLLKRSAQIAIGIIAAMFLFSAFGVNIGPLLAGAGVVGIAIGFGAQTLVRDTISGLFFLIDDAFRLGEYVDVGDVRGAVEKISIRSFQLRHHRGALNTVPFGEIRVLQNYSRDWAIMKLSFRVSFDTDVEKVRKILKRVGQQLLEEPAIGEDFLQPLKSQGVFEVDDYGLVIRVKFMCKPGKQFLIRRYAFMAVQKAFAENDIEFARPEVRVAASEEAAGETGKAYEKREQEAAVALDLARGAAPAAPDR